MSEKTNVETDLLEKLDDRLSRLSQARLALANQRIALDLLRGIDIDRQKPDNDASRLTLCTIVFQAGCISSPSQSQRITIHVPAHVYRAVLAHYTEEQGKIAEKEMAGL